MEALDQDDLGTVSTFDVAEVRLNINNHEELYTLQGYTMNEHFLVFINYFRLT